VLFETLTIPRPDKVLVRVMQGQGAISFRDFERLLLALGYSTIGRVAVTASTYTRE
jgi:hypothetical protein